MGGKLLTLLGGLVLIYAVLAVWITSFCTLSTIGMAVLAMVTIVLFVYRRFVYIVLVTLPRDYTMVSRYIKVLYFTRNYAKAGKTVVSIFKEQVASQPKRPCIYFEDQVWTLEDMAHYSNRVAHVFQEAGYKKGDVVALIMENRPEYVGMWLGLAQLGVITALINTNLRLQTLLHSINVAAPKAIIFTSQLAEALDIVRSNLNPSIELYELRNTAENDETMIAKSLKSLLDAAPIYPPVVLNPSGYNDKLLYIYTSGTTGLPKAAIILNSRFLLTTTAAKYALVISEEDVLYNPLPMYHTAGGVMGTGLALLVGTPVVIKAKFSASAYFSDCIKYKCTVSQYIGEMCRYILAVPPKPEDTAHNIRFMFGNGMRSSIWKQFVDRFNIPGVRELYGATEGNANIVNLDNTIGAVGAIPSLLMWWTGRAGVIRIDPETNEPIRNKNGLCIRCDADEPGMFVGMISASSIATDYQGYVDKDAAGKKIWTNVLSKGDRCFVSGDILVMNEFGYLFFKDRTGDTFRWKGENVATAEVEAVISQVVGLRDISAYGVEIPGQEGRAGMAAICDPDNSLDRISLASAVDASLPSYARPLFLRCVKQMDVTDTFKLRKHNLQKEGFNPSQVTDALYFRKGKTYVELMLELYQDIVSGKERL